MISPTAPRTRRNSSGFTLVELMITVVIATILVTVAVASYTSQVRKSRRTDAKTALLDLAGRQESFFSVNNSYAADWLSLGYSAGAGPTTTGLQVGSGYYNVFVCVPAGSAPCPASALAAPSYQVLAVPIGAQAGDASCQTMVVDSAGQQSSTDGGGADSTATCWQ